MSCSTNTANQVQARVLSIDFSQWTDEELILEYRATHQRAAFEELVHRYEKELFNFLRRYLGDAENAEDVFQATFLQIHLKCDHFDEERTFRPWLYRIATNQAIDFRRRAKKFQAISLDVSCTTEENSSDLADTLVSAEIDPLSDSISKEQVKQVREAVDRLPELLKQVLYLVYFQGMPYQDAAESLGLPLGTVKSRLHIAVKKLNFLLARHV